MKVKVFSLSRTERKAGPVKEFEYSKENFKRLAKELSRSECFVYIDLSGDLRIIESFEEVEKIVRELRSVGQQSLVLMKEDLEKFTFYSNSY
jgi:ATP-dependent RNA circularization protein (DNA/RNA ligase family)